MVQEIGRPNPDALRADRLKLKKDEWERLTRPALSGR
jgi:hypothetical protein